MKRTAPVVAVLVLMGSACALRAPDPLPPAKPAPCPVADLGAAATGILPRSADDTEATLRELLEEYADIHDGDVYRSGAPQVEPDWFGIAIATAAGDVYVSGDVDIPFPIQSTAKLFTYGLALDDHGLDVMLDRVGVNATGLPYGSLIASEIRSRKLQNPMVSPGAIATMATIRGRGERDRWRRVREMFARYAGHPLPLNQPVYDYEIANSDMSRAQAQVLFVRGLLEVPCKEAKPGCFRTPTTSELDALVKRYLKSTSQDVTARQLALMGATLANWGVNPRTRIRAIQAHNVSYVLSAMVTAGMYDASGQWLSRIGLPAKSGVSGNILAVVPGRFSIAVYSPPLDPSGNSVRGTAVMEELARRWELHRFAAPAVATP